MAVQSSYHLHLQGRPQGLQMVCAEANDGGSDWASDRRSDVGVIFDVALLAQLALGLIDWAASKVPYYWQWILKVAECSIVICRAC